MRYISTRGTAPVLAFEDVLLAGLARDGGLYVPESWPHFSEQEIKNFAVLSYTEVAYRVMAPFIGDAIPEDALRGMIEEAYAGFRHPDIAPLVKISDHEWVLELFHGPTLAFKDFALQLLGRLLDHALARRKERVTIVGATSGDTGSAAIAGCMGRDNMRVFILHPQGRVSDIQRRQMTTVLADNIHNIAVEGTFDDCQALVKAMFNDAAFRDTHKLAAVNSINWARIMAQVVYYFTAAVALGAPERKVSFAVPTGNFGDIYAGYVAMRMGLPIRRLIVATGRNDILARFFESGEYRAAKVVPTIAPSIDIQVSSNFERLLFDLCGRDGAEVVKRMEEFARSGTFSVSPAMLAEARKTFAAGRVQEDGIRKVIGDVYHDTGMLLDPHSAVGVGVGRALQEKGEPIVYLATAHPAKFPEAVREAAGVSPELPDHMKDISSRTERCDTLPADLAAIENYIESKAT
ncbi:MAG: threonine synthase [Alphaproteobacteria bacterium]|nr:threonine synthase [Alphaproteobacteria bacterium]